MPPTRQDTLDAIEQLEQAAAEWRSRSAELADTQAQLKEMKAHLRDLETEQARSVFAGGRPDPLRARQERGWIEQYVKGSTWTPDEASVLQKFAGWMKTGAVKFLEELGVQAGLSTDTDPDGGYAVPTVVQSVIEKRLRDISPMRTIARIWPTTDGRPRFLVDAGGVESGWVGEREERPETDIPELQGIEPPIGEVYAAPKATQWLLDDWQNAASWLEGSIVEEFAVQEGAAFVVGDGIKKPRGFTTFPTSSAGDSSRAPFTLQYIPTGDASAFIAPTTTASPVDHLIDAVHSLKAGYRQGAVWVMNKTTLGRVRKFKDSEGRFAVQPGLELGAPDRLLGYPIVEAEDMPAVGAGKFPIAFGNFLRGYTIVDRTMRMMRDPFTAKPHVVFYSTKRVGGTVLNFDAIKLVKVASS